MKKYILTIEYDEDTDEVEYLTEEIIEESPTFYLDDIILNDYFDEEILKLLKDVYIIGES